MLTFGLFCILIFGFLMGLRRGLILQALHLTGYIISFIIATIYYQKLAEKISLYIPYADLPADGAWAVFLANMPLEEAFYNGISFVIIFIGAKIVLQIIATMLDFVARLPILKWINSLFGAILGFVEIYLIAFILLYVAALVPITKVQTIIEGSGLATFIIEKTPYLSNKMETLWFIELLTQM